MARGRGGGHHPGPARHLDDQLRRLHERLGDRAVALGLAQQGVEVARALRDAGARAVYLSGAYKELGISDDEAAGIFDGRLFMGMDVVDILTRTFDVMGVAK